MTATTARLTDPKMYGFGIIFDAEENGWAILEPEGKDSGDAYDWADTRAAAVKLARQYGRERHLDTLRDELAELAAECSDVARLETALAALRGK